MRYYFAPLEGLTDSIFRSLHHKYFPGIDRYYTPFLSPTVHRKLTPREARELPRADTLDFEVVPQLLTKTPEDFLWMAGVCKELGYREVNLNLGCPSGTVTAKGKGSGMLKEPETLAGFLDEIFAATPIDISIKTRLGYTSAEEFPRLLEIFNRYPIKELTLHPRVRSAFYNGPVDMASFQYAADNSRAPLCYNGNLCSVSEITAIQKKFPQVGAVMLGRGLIADPGMFSADGNDLVRLENFYNALLEAYIDAFGGSRNAMFRMKENWHYLLLRFEGSEKLGKQLRKTTDLNQYKQITHQIFTTLSLKESFRLDG